MTHNCNHNGASAKHLLDLPSVVLVDILRYLQLRHVPAVAASCQVLHRLLYDAGGGHALWRSIHGNSLRSDDARRALPIVQLMVPCDCGQCGFDPGRVFREQLRAGATWHAGRPVEMTICSFLTHRRRGGRQTLAQQLMMPCLQLLGGSLLFSRGERLCCLKLPGAAGGCGPLGAWGCNPAYPGSAGADVTALSVASPAGDGYDDAFVGTADGRLLLWRPRRRPQPLLPQPVVDPSGREVTCLDTVHAGVSNSEVLLLAGTKSGVVCVARFQSDWDGSGARGDWQLAAGGNCWLSIDCLDRVYSCRLLPAPGLSAPTSALIGCAGVPRPGAEAAGSLRHLDLATGRFLDPLTDAGIDRRGSGILAIAALSPAAAVTVGYDAGVRLWDLRQPGAAGPAVRWDDSSDCTGTAVQTDQGCTVLVGLQQHGLVRLYDTRMTSRHVRSFYKGTHYQDRVARLIRSPVYSLGFNLRCFVRGLDAEINLLTFE